jgi:hypothetical protein
MLGKISMVLAHMVYSTFACSPQDQNCERPQLAARLGVRTQRRKYSIVRSLRKQTAHVFASCTDYARNRAGSSEEVLSTSLA